LFLEPFDPSSNSDFKPERDFKGRFVLLNREILLTEQTPEAFAAENDLYFFAEDTVAVNRAIRLRVETFAPTDTFKPSRRSRPGWRDQAAMSRASPSSQHPRP
jgi:hypothetical protein